ncbi:TIGR04452 family lipoprotein [Leptospira wolffii]|uniref:TIGR04452 family lipoprotein n=1 Tax=Leptospira wolffii TaxID=409998 RepID=A0ABV5BU40_9LEPT
MKRIHSLLFLLLAFAATNCVLLDETGYSDSYPGKEVKRRIKQQSMVLDYFQYNFIYPADTALLGVIVDQAVVDIILNIDDSKYYNKEDVHKCEFDLSKTIGVLGDYADAGTALPFAPGCKNLKPNGLIIK